MKSFALLRVLSSERGVLGLVGVPPMLSAGQGTFCSRHDRNANRTYAGHILPRVDCRAQQRVMKWFPNLM